MRKEGVFDERSYENEGEEFFVLSKQQLTHFENVVEQQIHVCEKRVEQVEKDDGIRYVYKSAATPDAKRNACYVIVRDFATQKRSLQMVEGVFKTKRQARNAGVEAEPIGAINIYTDLIGYATFENDAHQAPLMRDEAASKAWEWCRKPAVPLEKAKRAYVQSDLDTMLEAQIALCEIRMMKKEYGQRRDYN